MNNQPETKDFIIAAAIFVGMSAFFVVLRLLGGYSFNVFDFLNGALCSVIGFFFGMFAAEAIITLAEKITKKESTKAFRTGAWCASIAVFYMITYFKFNWWG